ncbi:MAG: hypothetical protein IT213_14970 [Cytophagales bacterium]|nr:hypothetical protein [Cytophagales bacterium]
MKKLFFLSAILLAGMVSHAQTDSLYMVTYTTGPGCKQATAGTTLV